MSKQDVLSGVGLGLRRSLLQDTYEAPAGSINFLEAAPENWINFGGAKRRQFELLAEKYPLVLHGLSLDLGGSSPINTGLVAAVKDFMKSYNCQYYSEHLSACGDHGQLYDLMPLPFCEEMIHHVAARIRQVQDILGRRIAIENASYYAVLDATQMDELSFIKAIIAEADCELMLDINNIEVNSVNHKYSATDFLKSLPGDKITYMHLAGHFHEREDLRIDTHDATVSDVTWDLLKTAYENFGVKPTLLERDSNYYPFEELLTELEHIKQVQSLCA